MMSNTTEANFGRLMHKIGTDQIWVPPQNIAKDNKAQLSIMPMDNRMPIKSAPAFLPNDTSTKASQSESDDQKSNINIKIEAKPTTQQVTKELVHKKHETPTTTIKSTEMVRKKLISLIFRQQKKLITKKKKRKKKRKRKKSMIRKRKGQTCLNMRKNLKLKLFLNKKSNILFLNVSIIFMRIKSSDEAHEVDMNNPAERPLDSEDDAGNNNDFKFEFLRGPRTPRNHRYFDWVL